MAKSKTGSAPRVVVVAQRRSSKPSHTGSRGGKWSKAAKFAGALFGVGILSYAARTLFPQNSALGRFVTTGLAGLALAAAFGSFKDTRSFATNYILPAAIGMAALDAGATVAQDWGEQLASKLSGGMQAVLPGTKPTAPGSYSPAISYNPPTAPAPAPAAPPQQQIIYQPAAPAYSKAQSNASIIAAAIAAAGQLGSSVIGAFAGSKGLSDEMASVRGSGQDVAATLFGS